MHRERADVHEGIVGAERVDVHEGIEDAERADYWESSEPFFTSVPQRRSESVLRERIVKEE